MLFDTVFSQDLRKTLKIPGLWNPREMCLDTLERSAAVVTSADSCLSMYFLCFLVCGGHNGKQSYESTRAFLPRRAVVEVWLMVVPVFAINWQLARVCELCAPPLPSIPGSTAPSKSNFLGEAFPSSTRRKAKLHAFLGRIGRELTLLQCMREQVVLSFCIIAWRGLHSGLLMLEEQALWGLNMPQAALKRAFYNTCIYERLGHPKAPIF
jgi:hypothetical protein